MTRTSRIALLTLTALVAACIFSVALFAQNANADVSTTLDARYQQNGVATEIPTPVAGSHPDFRQIVNITGSDDIRRFALDFPPGLIGDPNAIAAASRCTVDYTGVTATSGSPNYSSCPASSRVGSIRAVAQSGLTCSDITLNGSVYLLQNRPSANPEVPTHLGIHLSGAANVWLLFCAPLTATMNMTAQITLRPTDQGLRINIIDDLPKTDPLIGGDIRLKQIDETIHGMAPSGKPFLTVPTRCGASSTWGTTALSRAYSSNNNMNTSVDGIAYFASNSSRTGTCTGAAAPAHTFSLTQTTTKAGAPVGLRAVLNNPVPTTNVNQAPYAKSFSLVLPVGMKVNPAIGARLVGAGGGCTEAQFLRADANNPVTDATPTCPTTSEVGNVAVTVPEITGDLSGRIYLGEPRPGDAAAGIYRLYINAARGGVVTKFQGTATADPSNGQVTVTVDNTNTYFSGLPQFNYSKFDMDFNAASTGIGSPSSGAVTNPQDSQQMLTNPQWCGSHTATATVTQWSSPTQPNETFPTTLTTASASGAPCAFDTFAPGFSAKLTNAGTGSGGALNSKASQHPDLTLSVTRADRTDNLKTLVFKLPFGFAGSATAVPTCSGITSGSLGTCTNTHRLGTANVQVGNGPTTVPMSSTIYNVATDNSSQTAKLAIVTPANVGPFSLGNVINYSILTLDNTSTFRLVSTTDLTQSILGIPIDYRSLDLTLNGMAGSVPFLTNPSATCSSPLTFSSSITSAGAPNGSSSAPTTPSTVAGSDTDQSLDCATNVPPFALTMSVTPSTLATAQPTGLNITLNQSQTAATTQQSTVKRVTVTMPNGLEINPGFASSVTACPTATINTDLANATDNCSGAATKLADVTVTTPLLGSTVAGQVYLEAPGSTPTTRYRVVMYLSMPGGLIIVRGSVDLNGSTTGGVSGSTGAVNSGTGQLTAVFDNLPDVPWSSMSLNFNSATPMFVNSDTVGTQTFNGSFQPHSATSTNPATANASYLTNYNGTVGSTGTDPWAPTFSQTISSTVPSAHPNLTMTVNRPEKSQQLSSVTYALPSGLTGAPAAVPTCSQVQADAAACPANTRIGSISASVGSALVATPGVGLASLNGSLYNTAAAGAIAKFTAVVPVVLGPFNMGSLTLPVALSMRPGTDPDPYGLNATVSLPSRYEGVKIRYRSVAVTINGVAPGNGANFLTNPSQCATSKTTTATMTSHLANVATGTQSFTTDACAGGFAVAPTTTVATNPATPATQSPVGLGVTVSNATGNSTMKQLRLTFPSGMSVNPAVGNYPAGFTCPTATIDSSSGGTDACSAAGKQVVGTVSMTTPLISGTFNGSVYLETPAASGSPDTRFRVAMIVALPGQSLIIRGKVRVNGDTTVPAGATGSVDSGTGIVTADFDNLPDLSFNNLTVNLATGSKALLVTPTTCSATNTITAQMYPYSNPSSATSNNSNFNTNSPCVATSFNPTFTASVSDSNANANPTLTMAVTNPGATVDFLRSVTYHMPTGFVANTNNVARCSQANATAGTCATPAVGTATAAVGTNAEQYTLSGSVYNVTPNASEPARFQAIIPVTVGPFNLGNLSVPVTTSMRADLGIDATAQLPQKYEGIDIRARALTVTLAGTVGGQPFFENPSACQTVSSFSADISNGVTPQNKVSPSFAINGCPKVFGTAPTLSVTPSTTQAADPVGLTFNIGSAASNPTIKRVQLDFPTGMEINPAFANGLTACTAPTVAGCASATSIATVSLTTPLLSTSPISGNVYVVAPGTTASTRYKVVMIVDLPGTNELIVQGAVTINGSTTIPTGGTGAVDSGTGKIYADFNNIPDLGFTAMTLAFNSGSNAMVVNNEVNATNTFTGTFTNHAGGADVTASPSFATTGASGPLFAPTFNGSATPTTSAGNPDLTLNFVRPDYHRDLRNITVSLPTGLVAATSATSLCSQATAAAGGCAANQIVGSVATTIGSGSSTYSLNGSIYNVAANASEAARFSAMIPVVVGPFDLGKLTIPVPATLRSDLGVDATAQLPTRYEGIAVRIRSLTMVLNDTANGNPFMINPSKCQSNSVGASMTSDGGSPATVASSFSYTTTGCTGFTTAPSLTVATSSSVPADPAGLTFTINSAANNPTMKRVQLTFPSGMEINPAFGTGLTACPTATINAGGAGCLASATLANVTMVTPLLNSNPTGKVYLESPGTTATTRYKVAMVIDLPGQKLIVRGAININGSSTIPTGGTGAVDSGTGQISADFDNIPDLGFTSLTMAFNSGANAMVVNPETCANSFGATFTPNSNTGATSSSSPSYPLTGCGTFGFDPSFTASVDNTTPAGHPNLTLNVARSDKQKTLKTMAIHLPTGLVANTSAVATPCSQASAAAATCATTAAASQVGTFSTSFGSGTSSFSLAGGQIFQVTPNSTEPVRFAAIIPVVVGPFDLGKLTIPVTSSIRADYGIDVNATMPQRYEGIAVRLRTLSMTLNSTVGGNNYMTNPSKCQSNTISAEFTAGDNSPDTSSTNNSSSFTTAGCSATVPAYNPTLSATVNPTTAGAPTALTLGVGVPANSATTSRVQVALPVGMELNPGVGNGLVACSTIDSDASSSNPCKLTSSNIATVTLNTPLLPGAQTGEVYLETPGTTAATRYKLALVIHLPGRDMVIKGGTLVNGSTTIPSGGLGSTDAAGTATGQVTADFPGIPDLGFTNMSIAFNSGSKLFVNPTTAATHTVQGTLTPHSVATTKSANGTFTTAGGTSAVTGWNPTFSAALSTSVSASNPNLTLNIGNPLGTQELKSFGVKLPVGLVANTTAVPRCTQANADAGNCAAGNLVGTVSTTFGSSDTVGEDYTVSGTIYNVIPNADQPARLQAIVPVMVGPFDLGKLSIPVPTTLNSDLTVTASASLPSRYEGIAVRVRAMQMVIQGEPNGNKFMVAPTKCGASNITGTLTSDTSSSATLSSAINITGCPTNFGASPTLAVTPDTTTRTTPVNLTFGLTSNANNPTIGRVQVAMPTGMEINPGFANNLSACSTASIDAGGSSCPASSQIGTANLKTQLLDPATSYTGKVYLETPGSTATTRYKIAMVVDLPGAKLVVHGKVSINGSSTIPTGGTGAVDSGTGQIIADFDTIPDLGFTELNLVFNSTNPMLVNPQTCTSNTFSATITPSSNGTNATPTAAYSTTPAGCGDTFGPNFSVTVDGGGSAPAGSHPNLEIHVDRPNGTSASNQRYLRDLNLDLPVGLVAATTATTHCSQANALAGNCSSDNQVGSFGTFIGNGTADASNLELAGQIYNVTPNVNEPARLAAITDVQVGPYNLGKLVIPIGTQLNPDLSVSTTTTIPRRYEGIAVRIKKLDISLDGIAQSTGKPFISVPSKCQNNTVTANMVSDIATNATRTSSFTTTGCPRDFAVAPTVGVTSTPNDTTVPTGLGVTIGSDPLNSTISRFQLALPNDMSINANAGNGLATCSAALINAGGSGCPASSNQGTVTLTTPLLGADQTGNVYLEDPGSTGATRYKLAIVVHLPGTDMILRGKVLVNGSSDITGGLGATDTGTGRITTDFDTIPDLQFTQMVINFNTGDRALLTNPDTCGTQTTNSTITPSSGGADAAVDSSFTLTNTLGCAASKPFDPTFTATADDTTSGANTDLDLTVTAGAKNEYLRNFNLKLPVGLVADTTATDTTCSQAQAAAATCTAASQVGAVVTKLGTGTETLDLPGTIHNVVPNADEPARLAVLVPVLVGPYDLGKLTIPVPTSLRGSDYGVDATAQLPTKYEGINVRLAEMTMTLDGMADQGTVSTGDDKGFIKNPSKCDDGSGTKLAADLVPLTGSTVTRSADYPVTGCPRDFSPNPTLTVSNTTNTTAVPTGMTLQFDSAASNPTIGSVDTTMPLGMTLNPAVANLNGGIDACSTATIDALKLNPNATPCPAASKVGDVSLITPLLPGTKTGAIYLEEPGNTAATRYKLVMIVDLPGTKLIVRGSTTVDGSSDLTGGLGATDGGSPTGRIAANFDSIPDLGFTQLTIAFSGGSNALFTNSETEGTQTVAAEITPQSGGSTITANGTFSTVYGGSGSQASEPFNPTFGATFSTLDAAANPDVTITVTRDDYTQQIKDFDLHLPPGLVANTVLTPRCEQTDAAAGTCGADSAVGSVTTKIGTGSDQLTMNGTLYNVIPDADEPARLAVVMAVQVGPYNLGKLSLPVTTEIVTGAEASDLSIDTHTALPKFYEGVPVRLRELQIQLDGIADQGTPGDTSDDQPFMINPSQCTDHTLMATMTSTLDNSVTVGSPGGDFTTVNCENAPYNPAISASLSTTERGKPVGIDLGFEFSGNSSSTKKIVTTFPVGMSINPGVGNYGSGMTCADATVEAGGAGCPSSSRLGTVALDTPLLPTTQTGALYLLPPVGNQAARRYRLGLFVDLPGAGDLYTTGSVTVDGSSDVPTGGTGAVDAGDGQVVATFDNLPDLQFSDLTLSFKTTGAGEHALLTNPNTCGTFDITADMSPWARPTTSEQASTSFTTTDTVASCIETESADQPGYVSAELGEPGPDFNNPAGPAYFAGSSQPVTMTVNRPDSDKTIKRVKFLLPPGLVGSADAAPTCSQVSADAGDCATSVANNASQIGTVTLKIGDSSDTYEITGGLFNTDAPSNRPAKFTFIADVNVGPFAFGKVIVPVDVNLDNNDYSLFAETGDMPQVFEGIPVRISQMTIALVGTADQGTPGDTSDDKVFMSNPRSCSTTLNVRAVITSSPGNTTKDATAPLAGPFTNCGNLNLNANTVTIENEPVAPETGHGAEHPTGLNVQVHQDENLATQATLKELELDLPGFRLSAPAANGLAACSASQLDSQTCPAASRVGTAWIDTSLLPKDQTSPDGPGTHSLWGAVYLETPGTASDGSDRYKLAIQLTGKTLITIRGIAHVNETTGEITTKFDGLPDIPFTDFRVELTGSKTVVGPTTTYFPLLLNPEGVVGSASTVQANANLTPHSGTAPVTRSSTLPVDAALAKTFTATTSSNISPLTSGGHPNAEFNISRADGQEDIKNVAMQLPAGFLGSAAAVPLCPVASASAGSCNDQSKVGEVVAEIGQYGQKLTLPGTIYLTEGVGGDIAGMSIKVPAKAGPYDLGDFITQGRIQIRPTDHGITVNFVDVPKMFKGVPTHIQNMDISLPGIAQSTQKPFLYNASDCSPFSIVTSLTPYAGAVVQDSDPYQATGCPSRAFNPAISFAATSPGDDRTAPSWQIKLNSAPGNSTLKSTTVLLPSIMTVNVQGIADACPAEQVNTRTCPASSVIGTVSINTPLLSAPVTGTIYMAKSISGQSLPDMLIDIPAPIDMQVRGANSFVTAGNAASQIRSTFTNLPDLIWGDMTMNITGGPKGILGLRSNGNCGSASSSFTSHSGQATSAESQVRGIEGYCQGIAATCQAPTVKLATKGVKKNKYKKATTKLSLVTATHCAAIKAVRVTYPKGTKINRKLLKYKKLKVKKSYSRSKKAKIKKQQKAFNKNLRNITGGAGTTKLRVNDYAVSGSRGLKIKKAFPTNARSFSINTKNSAVVLPYKTFCGKITKKLYTKKYKKSYLRKYKKKYKSKLNTKYKKDLSKCQKKKVTFTFEITNADGTAFRYNYSVAAGSKFFK